MEKPLFTTFCILVSMNEDRAIVTLRVTADVVLSGRQAVSVLTSLGVRNSLAAGRLFILLHT